MNERLTIQDLIDLLAAKHSMTCLLYTSDAADE